MSEVQVTTEIKGFARLKIHSGKIQEFKDLQAKCLAVVRAKDTGTLQYEVFFNDDSSECIVYERYRDSDALLEHFSNLGALMPALFRVCSAGGAVLSQCDGPVLRGSPLAQEAHPVSQARGMDLLAVGPCPTNEILMGPVRNDLRGGIPPACRNKLLMQFCIIRAAEH